VLDLGSGEGFGAAILADVALHVVGLDVDERTVEHSTLNYAGANLEFHVGDALDLSQHETGSFGAVVAFEIIEHVRGQEQMLVEIARVLADDGLVVISTPDRRIYSEASGQSNPFHERELTLDEFVQLLEVNFPHVATWGQRTITGSHMNTSVGTESHEGHARAVGGMRDFYIERSGDEWRLAGDPAALYCVALASRQPLPDLPRTSTLADCGLQLMRDRERDAVFVASERDNLARSSEELSSTLERERVANVRALRDRESQMNDELVQRERNIGTGQERIAELRQKLAALQGGLGSLELELADARQLNRRTEESVTWQAFQKARGRLYGAIGESSLFARTLRVSLRLAGRALVRRPSAVKSSPELEEAAVERIALPEYEDPKVSLVIPLHAHAELTRACLESICDNTTHAGYEVILIDDMADAGTKRLLDGVSGATILHNDTNIGYLRSVNKAASVARGRWLVLCNNDIEMTRNWLQVMLACAESADDIGIVTPKYVYPDGSLNEAGGIIWRDGTGMNYGRGEQPEGFPYEYRRETDYGSAAALMVSAKLWREVGGYDERYLPMYYEDADLCFEARARGLRVMYEPEAIVVHVEGATAGNNVASGHKRHQEDNRAKFVSKWHHRLETEQMRSALTNVRIAADRHRGPRVLVVDYRVPMWDHDAGSLRMLSMIRGLVGLGAHVTFMPDNFLPLQPYTRVLQRLGVEVLYGNLDINAELATIGPRLDLAILSRPHVASRWLDTLREVAPSATLVYDTVDLHWLREARKGALSARSWDKVGETNGSRAPMTPRAAALRELELAMMRAADVSLVVSDSEQQQVETDVPGADVRVIPTVHAVEPHVPPAEGRTGILFVGGFAHPPNVDAAVGLVKDVMPAVWRELGDVKVTIVGPDPPPEVQALASPLVDVTGWIEDLQPVFDRSRMMIAPLRYGAGMKGKVTQSLAFGVPVVTTPIGAEGHEHAGDCLLVGDSPQSLAVHAIKVYRDDEFWRGVSRAGQAFVAEHCSSAVIAERLGELLASVPTHAIETTLASS
jgi:GT2 family glycosyltransferase/glycosyltransferase involved in cell wall biosynthesis/SAM-dependent methyltransferase